MSRQGIAPILILAVAGALIIASATFWAKFMPWHRNAHMDRASSTTNIGTSSKSSATTKENTCPFGSLKVEAPQRSEGVFTTPITDINSISVISSGNLVGDSRFTYLWIKDGIRVPVYAPANGVLVKISYKNRLDLAPGMSTPDYDLVFLVDCHTLYRLNHITDPIPEIAALKPNSEPLPLGTGYPSPSDADTKPKKNIKVKAGDKLGTTTGTAAAHNWDFGIFVDQKAVCPYTQFQEPIRSAWLNMFGNGKIAFKPVPGTPCEVSGSF